MIRVCGTPLFEIKGDFCRFQTDLETAHRRTRDLRGFVRCSACRSEFDPLAEAWYQGFLADYCGACYLTGLASGLDLSQLRDFISLASDAAESPMWQESFT